MKKIFITVSLFFILFLSWYLISPAFKTVEIYEPSPLEDLNVDSKTKMDSAMKELFDKEMKKMKEKSVVMNEESPFESEIISQGELLAQAHEVEGKVILINVDQQKILRFENFETTNGPNLHIYLSPDLEANDYVDLGKIKATKGNVNYKVGSSIDLEKYNKVLVWCVPFKVLFSYAELS